MKRGLTMTALSCFCGALSYRLIANAPDVAPTVADVWLRAASVGLFIGMALCAITAVVMFVDEL